MENATTGSSRAKFKVNKEIELFQMNRKILRHATESWEAFSLSNYPSFARL